MKKILLLLILLANSANGFAAFVFTAANDYVQLPSSSSGIAIQDILRNDLDGFTGVFLDSYFAPPVNGANVTIALLSQSSPLVYLDGHSVVVAPDTPDGIYTMTYQICRISNGQCSTTGTISVKIGGNKPSAPILNYTQPTPACGNVNSMQISGLPAGDWVLLIERSGIWHKVLTGSGTEYNTFSGTTASNDVGPGFEFRMAVVDLATMSVSDYSPIVLLPEYECDLAFDIVSTYNDYNNDGLLNVGDRIDYVITVTNVFVNATPYTFYNVTLDTFNNDVVENTIVPTLAYQASAVFMAYHNIQQNDINLGVAYSLFNSWAFNANNTHYWEQPFRTTFHLPDLPTLAVSESSDTNVAVYPNPTNGMLHINVKDETPKTIQITNLLGKTVQSTNSISLQTQMDLSALQSGMYFVTVKTADRSKTVKIIKQ